MLIRTITAGADEADIDRAAAAARLARERLVAVGYQVQTLRLALPPPEATVELVQYARQAERHALDAGFDYVSLGPLDHALLPALPEAIVATQAVFAAASLIGADGEVARRVIDATATAIVAIGAATQDGFGNLRLAALAGVGPGSPFFPAAYHDRGDPWVAVGPEAAALAVQATTELRMKSEELRNNEPQFSILNSQFSILTELIEQHDARITGALADLESTTGIRFAGCDWSLAPHPDPTRSVGAAIEAFSGVPFGAWGTLPAVRGLTDAIRAARVTRLGFSGVMLPVLEDETLARRNAEGRYTLRDLLAFSAVCGTGLDTIPLPGDTPPSSIAGVLGEVAALAAALRKPLTARLLPIPGLKAGDSTTFDFPYFVNTRVMRIE
jgi:uncharacterized protein (UPF0210 family)